MTITKSKCVSFSFSSRPTDPTLLLIFSLQQEINLEWPYTGRCRQGLFAESAIIMCTGFNCIPCMPKTALSSVMATPAHKRPFYELSPDTVQDVFYVLSLGPHFCHPIPSFDKSTGDGWGLITL